MAKQTFTTGQVLTAGQMTSLQQTAMGGGAATAKTTSYTLVAADAGTVVAMNSASPTTITVNTGLFAAGDTVQIQNLGAGVLTVTAGTATVSTSAVLTLKQYDGGSLYFVSSSAAIFFSSDAADSPLTTKGDLYTYSTTNDRLAVGNNGETLVADSSTSTGLRWQGSQAAGKNAVINGGMDIWQRGTASTAGGANYRADRWYSGRGGAVSGGTWTRQSSGLDGFQYCLRVARDSANTSTATFYLSSTLETANSLQFAGKTVTMSFYARAGANFSPTSGNINVYLKTGTGTDQNVSETWTGNTNVVSSTATLTTTWQRFTYTGSIGSSATEIGVNLEWTPVGTAGANDYLEITGVQLELGSVATAFQRTGGTIQGELAACQRYYTRLNTAAVANCQFGNGFAGTTSIATFTVPLPVKLRVTSSNTLDYSGLRVMDYNNGYTISTIGQYQNATDNSIWINANMSSASLTQYRPCILDTVANGYLGISAEL